MLRLAAVLLALLLALLPAAAAAQPSAPAAFGRSLVAPGWGHHAVHGDWNGAATAFVLADAALWTGLAATAWRRGDLQESLETLAAAGAGADLAAHDRRYALQLATFRTSEAYREAMLRNRAWDAADAYRAPDDAWTWTDEADYQRFRTLRERTEAARRRIPVLVGLLAGNRLIAGIAAARAARRADAPRVAAALGAPPPDAAAPVLHLRVNF